MNKITRYIILTFLLSLHCVGFSQENTKNGEVFVSNNFNETSPSIHIKWISKSVYFLEGCNVYRKSSNSDSWQKINKEPVLLKQTPGNNGTSFDKDTRNLYEATRDMDYQEFQSNFIRAFVVIKAIYNNEMAESVGMYFIDKNVSKTETYSYKVMSITNGVETEVGISAAIKCEAYTKTEPPLDIVVDRQRLRIDFVWKPELLRYYGVEVYRKSNLDADFVKISKVPRAVQKVQNRAGETVFPKVFYSDLKFDKKLSYEYKFVAIDYFGKPSEESPVITAFVKDFDPPVPVTSLKIFPYAKELNVQLSWAASISEDVYGYNVYRSKKMDGPYVKINEEIIAETEYLDILNQPGGYYYYVGTADYSQNEGLSGKVFMDLKDIIPPEAPKGFKSVADTGIIALSWQANTEGDLLGYFIQRSLADEDNLDNRYININADPITNTSYNQKMAKHIKNKFVYRVVAVDTSFNYSKPSINSLAQMPDVVAPAIPVIKFIKPQEKSIKVEWLPNIDSDLKGYNVYRKNITKQTETEKVNFSLIPKDFKFYEVRNLVYEDKCEYYVTAIDENGNESASSKGFAFTLKAKQDSIKEQFNLTFKNNQKRKTLRLQWQKVEEIKGYVVFSSLNNDVFKPISGMLTDINQYNIKIDKNSHQFYQVRVYKLNGKKIISNTIEIK